MKNKVEIILVIVISLLITLLCFYCLKADFLLQRKKLVFTASHSFLKAIDVEKTIKLKDVQVSGSYKPIFSPDTIPFIEKDNWCNQYFFIKHDSIRQTLDSLFRVELAKQDISVQVAIRFLFEGKAVYSNPDSLFYQQAIALSPVVYRLDEKPEGRCELQAYVKLPFLVVLKQMYFGGIVIVFSWLLSLLTIVGIFCYSRKKRIVEPVSVPTIEPVAEPVVAEPVVVQVVEERSVQLTEPVVVWTHLADDLEFDRKYGVLMNKGCAVKLPNNRLLLFRLFLNAPHHQLIVADLYELILGRKIEKPTKSDRDVIAATIKRLRDDLASCPLKIKNLRGNGYQLLIDPDNADTKYEQPLNGEPEAVVPKETFNTLDTEIDPAESKKDV